MTSELSPVTDEEIEWAAQLMGLQELDKPRLDFIRTLDSVDISACPGSGKTTLILAKLAILAERWESKTSGIAVLSHTNVAREEVENRLVHGSNARRVLSYPHAIETIHAFTNKYVVAPWLTSQGIHISLIDNVATASIRRRILGGEAWKLEAYLKKRRKTWDDLVIVSTDLDDPLGGKFFGAGPLTDSYKLATKAIKGSLIQGCLRFDEVLTLGAHISESNNNLVCALRKRFPLVLVDEMQDTQPLQVRVIDGLFHRVIDGSLTQLQRVGDINQAIFSNPTEPMVSDFPRTSTRSISVSNSFRLSSATASLANHLAVSPVLPSGLIGRGSPNFSSSTNPNRIFVFPKNDTSGVLERFANHVAGLLHPNEIASANVWAVGLRHAPSDDVGPGHKHFPKTVSHYWTGYEANVGRPTYSPACLAEYVAKAVLQRGTNTTASAAVQTIASAVLHSARILRPGAVSRSVFNGHRLISRLINDDEAASSEYKRLIGDLLGKRLVLTAADWPDLQARICGVAAKIADAPYRTSDVFFQWNVPDNGYGKYSVNSDKSVDPNSFEYKVETTGRPIKVKLGSIHSVKGQTHTATLLLETFSHSHHLKELLNHFETAHDKPSPKQAKARTPYWMRSAFVAMTRPTHSICLALTEESLGESEQAQKQRIEKLTSSGWIVDTQ